MPIRSLAREQIFDSVSMATRYDEPRPVQNQQFFDPRQLQTPRAQFMLKYTNQDRRHEPQTSILQALFLMNGKFMADRTKLENNQDLKDLAAQTKGGHPAPIRSLYMIVLSRPPPPHQINRFLPYPTIA